MEQSSNNNNNGEEMLKEEYSSEDNAKNVAQNTALSIATLLDSHGKSIIGNSSNIVYNTDNIQKLYGLTMEIREKQKMIEERLGMSSGGSGEQDQKQAVASVQPSQGMQKPEMSPEEALQIMAQNSMQNNQSGGR